MNYWRSKGLIVSAVMMFIVIEQQSLAYEKIPLAMGNQNPFRPVLNDKLSDNIEVDNNSQAQNSNNKVSSNDDIASQLDSRENTFKTVFPNQPLAHISLEGRLIDNQMHVLWFGAFEVDGLEKVKLDGTFEDIRVGDMYTPFCFAEMIPNCVLIDDVVVGTLLGSNSLDIDTL